MLLVALAGFPAGVALAQEVPPSEDAEIEPITDAAPKPPAPKPEPATPAKPAMPAKPAVQQAPVVTATALPGDKKTDDEPQPVYNAVVLQGLNKVTGHTSKLEGALGTVFHFGTLEITVKRCWKAPPEERPENAGLMEISELKPGEGPQKIFLGWMFSSSPGLSGLEHAVYDINMLSCEYRPELEKKPEPAHPAKSESKPAPKPAPKDKDAAAKKAAKSKKAPAKPKKTEPQ